MMILIMILMMILTMILMMIHDDTDDDTDDGGRGNRRPLPDLVLARMSILEVLCSTLQYCTVLYSAVQCGAEASKKNPRTLLEVFGT